MSPIPVKSLSIAASHPSLPGHFPGHPIVPGVVILNKVIALLRAELPDGSIVGIKKMKFLTPLAADQLFTVQCKPIKNQGLRFQCLLADGELLAEGHLKLNPLMPNNITVA